MQKNESAGSNVLQEVIERATSRETMQKEIDGESYLCFPLVIMI